jgi:DNA-binding LytR/AlgR family response regulator
MFSFPCRVCASHVIAAAALASHGGMQIHRSWWVNLKHASGLEKSETGGIRLVLRNVIRIPVPRSRISDVKCALAAEHSGDGGQA